MISIAITTYNGEKYLREQLDSIYCQTLVPEEVIAVDDCSTDNTVEILKEYHEKYGLKYFVNETNLSYNKNFEKAIALCNGDYIALCDQDDIWLPTKIEKCFNKIREYPLSRPALVSSFSSNNPEILKTGVGKIFRSGGWKLNFVSYLSQGCTLFFNKKLKDVILPFPDEIMYDSYIGLSASLIGNRYYIGEQIMYYRIHDNNSFAMQVKESFVSMMLRNLHKHIPMWYGLERYRGLVLVRDRFKEIAIKSHLEYVNKIISLYEIKTKNRITILWSIKDISLFKRILIINLLCIKIIFNISDSE